MEANTTTGGSPLKELRGLGLHDPTQSGQSIPEHRVASLDLTVTISTDRLGISRRSLSEWLNGHNEVSHELAVCPESAGSSNADTGRAKRPQKSFCRARKRANWFRMCRNPAGSTPVRATNRSAVGSLARTAGLQTAPCHDRTAPMSSLA